MISNDFMISAVREIETIFENQPDSRPPMERPREMSKTVMHPAVPAAGDAGRASPAAGTRRRCCQNFGQF